MASSPITSWQIDGKTMETDRLTDFFLGSRITADGDCSHKVKRHLLLWRKAMTNLDSILKSRDITLPTNIHLIKAMVFPVVMYGCDSWTIKKAEGQKNWFFWTVVLEKTLESPLSCKEIKSVNPKGNQSWIVTGRTKLQYFGHLMRRANSLNKTLMPGNIEGRRRRGRQRMIWLDGITNSTWVWASSGRWGRTGKPGVLQSVGSQKSWPWQSNWTNTPGFRS